VLEMDKLRQGYDSAGAGQKGQITRKIKKLEKDRGLLLKELKDRFGL